VLSIDGMEGAGAETVPDDDLTPEDRVIAAERLQYLRAGVESLPERLQHVVTELFFHDRPVTELAEELGVTQSRISQLRTEALALLKDGMNASLAPDLVPAAERPEGVAERRRRAYFAEVAARAARNANAAGAFTAGSVPQPHAATHDHPTRVAG